jgi:hypothetical protein
MPLIKNNFTQTNTEYFLEHVPFTTNANEEAIDKLIDMYSISVVPSGNVTTIKDGFGLENSYELVISIRNLTTNVTLVADLEYGDFFVTESETSDVTILPQQTIDFIIKTDRDNIDIQPSPFTFNTNAAVTIRNQQSSSVAIRNKLTPLFPQNSLPKEITIV